MIGRITGKYVEQNEGAALVDVGGVAYEVEVPISTLETLQPDTECVLYTHQVFQQDAQLLFGFPNQPMREFFRILIKIPSVGPKSALAILSTYSLSELNKIAHERDVAFLTRVKGIGKRGAERIVVDLANRLDEIPLAVEDAIDRTSTIDEAIVALVNLGYRNADARRAVDASWHEGIPIEDLVKSSLHRLSPSA